MRRFVSFMLTVAVLGGGGWYLKNHKVPALEKIISSVLTSTSEVEHGEAGPPAERTQRADGTIRVASFNIQVFGEKKISKPNVTAILAHIIRQFDVVAIQEIRSKNNIMPQFLDAINAEGARYDYVLGPREGRTTSQEQYAFIFDTSTIEVDRSAMYVVQDPQDLLHREPLVGWFRVRGPAPNQAFTFSLVNIHTDPDETKQELNALGSVFRAVRDDGRNEDDVILLGDLNVDDHHLGQLGQISQIHAAITGVASNTHGDKLYDNIVFTDSATSEYTGRWGVFDMMRRYNLKMNEALEISDHMPVWAEFSVYEGGRDGRLATRPFNPAAR